MFKQSQLNNLVKYWPKILLIIFVGILAWSCFLVWQVYQTIYQIDTASFEIEKVEIKKDLWQKVIGELEGRTLRLKNALDKTYRNPF